MKILLTLDYEMFNGVDGGTVDNTILKPMRMLQSILVKYGIKITIFADVCFLLQLRELAKNNKVAKADYNNIIDQIKELAVWGHDIQLHIHPNWMNMKFEDGRYKSNTSKLKLSDIEIDEAYGIFSEGIQLLKEITNKDVTAFRAGAYCIQTLSDMPSLFKKNGIVLDSSVLRNKKSITEKREWFDYTSIPSSYAYRFNDDVTKEVEDGCFFELSIPSYRISPLKIIINKLLLKVRRSDVNKWGDGIGSIGTLDGSVNKVFKRVKRLLHPYVVANIDDTTSAFICNIFDKERENGSPYMMIMGHPKNFSPYSLHQFERFLMKNSKQTDFVTVTDFI